VLPEAMRGSLDPEGRLLSPETAELIAFRRTSVDRLPMHIIFAAAVLSLGLALVPVRVVTPQGRAPRTPQHGLQAPRMWQDRTGQFALARPDNERWMFRAGVRGPDGQPVPLLALSQETGAQLVVQSTDGINDLRLLARMLMENLSNQGRVHVEDVERVLARGGDAYGFAFSVADEVRGRVAVVRAGSHVALVIASWPMGAPPEVVDDVESMIGSLGPVPGALPPDVF
jgi:hypothetical protein